jgi:hypothetical protein
MSEDKSEGTPCPVLFDMDEPMIWTVTRVSGPVTEVDEKSIEMGWIRRTLLAIRRILNGH